MNCIDQSVFSIEEFEESLGGELSLFSLRAPWLLLLPQSGQVLLELLPYLPFHDRNQDLFLLEIEAILCDPYVPNC